MGKLNAELQRKRPDNRTGMARDELRFDGGYESWFERERKVMWGKWDE